MKYLSLCSGIEAASTAWHPLGWTPVAFSEIDPFPCAVLAHHYPDVPNWGDMTRFKEWPDATVDILVGGTPCQSFSVAGLRAGLDDPRGNLALVYLAVADRYRPKWLVWENVPGVLSSDGGRAMGSILGAMAKLGYGFAYRVLDAQYVRVDGFRRAVPQRRRRVFVVGYFGDWRPAAAVLFERESLSGNTAPRREAGQVAPTVPARSTAGGGLGTDLEGINTTADEGQTAVPVAFHHNAQTYQLPGPNRDMTVTDSLTCSQQAAVAFDMRGREGGSMPEGPHETANIRAASGGSSKSYVACQYAVRRLTPRECERLQGFPDDYTLIEYRGKPAKDGPRYKALGNSMAVNVMRWIGKRIDSTQDILNKEVDDAAA